MTGSARFQRIRRILKSQTKTKRTPTRRKRKISRNWSAFQQMAEHRGVVQAHKEAVQAVVGQVVEAAPVVVEPVALREAVVLVVL